MKNLTLIKETIKTESKFSIAYILDYLKPGSFYTYTQDSYKKPELREKLFKLIETSSYYERLLKLETYKKFKQ